MRAEARGKSGLRVILAVGVAVLVLGGCGADDDSGAGGQAASTTSTEEPTSTTEEPTTSTTEEPTTSTTETTTSSIEDTTGLPQERCRGAESPPNIINVISYGTDCGAVEAAMAELESVGKEFRIGDFECARVSGGPLGGTWECRGEASYFTFEFGD